MSTTNNIKRKKRLNETALFKAMHGTRKLKRSWEAMAPLKLPVRTEALTQSASLHSYDCNCLLLKINE